MSETLSSERVADEAVVGVESSHGRRSSGRRRVLSLAPWLVLTAVPFVFEDGLVNIGLFCLVYVVAVLGLNVQTGWAGQLSLGHVFFLAAGAYTYTYLASERDVVDAVSGRVLGAHLPTLVAAVVAVVVSGLLGLLFTPVSMRLSGLYLGIASLALVFIGQHLIQNLPLITGAGNGRRVPGLNVLGLNVESVDTAVAAVPISRNQVLWWVLLAVTAGCYYFVKGVVGGRTGVAFQAVRSNEALAASMGVDVFAYKARAFVIGATLSGLAGVMYAISTSYISSGSFTLWVSFYFVVAVVVGGPGSLIGGSIAAAGIAALPLLGTRYADMLPLVSATPGQGLTGGELADYIYGGLVLAVLLVGRDRWRRLAGPVRRIVSGRRSLSPVSGD